MKQLRIDVGRCDYGRHCEHECEHACAEKVFKLKDPAMAALHIRELPDGKGVAALCDQCGDCVVVCPADALRRNKPGVILLDKKARKQTLVRDRYTLLGTEYEQLVALKQQFADQGLAVKKSELLRAGLALFAALDEEERKAALAKLPKIG